MTEHREPYRPDPTDNQFKLAPSGRSTWNPRVEMLDGELYLYWGHGEHESARIFSKEEVQNLYLFLREQLQPKEPSVEAAIQLLAAHVVNMRIEILDIKGMIVKEAQRAEAAARSASEKMLEKVFPAEEDFAASV